MSSVLPTGYQYTPIFIATVLALLYRGRVAYVASLVGGIPHRNNMIFQSTPISSYAEFIALSASLALQISKSFYTSALPVAAAGAASASATDSVSVLDANNGILFNVVSVIQQHFSGFNPFLLFIFVLHVLVRFSIYIYILLNKNRFDVVFYLCQIAPNMPSSIKAKTSISPLLSTSWKSLFFIDALIFALHGIVIGSHLPAKIVLPAIAVCAALFKGLDSHIQAIAEKYYTEYEKEKNPNATTAPNKLNQIPFPNKPTDAPRDLKIPPLAAKSTPTPIPSSTVSSKKKDADSDDELEIKKTSSNSDNAKKSKLQASSYYYAHQGTRKEYIVTDGLPKKLS